MFATFDGTMSGVRKNRGGRVRTKRKQVARACDWCRLNRVKCNDNDPCDNCAERGNLCVTGSNEVRTLASATKEIERLKTHIRDLEANVREKEAISSLQEAPSTSSVPASDSSKCTATQTSATRAAIWIPDDATGCLRYCDYSSTVSMMHRCHKYLSSALEQPELSNPFVFEIAASPISTADDRAHSDLMSMTRLQEEHYLNLFWQSYHILLPILHFETFTQHYDSLWIPDNSVRGDSALVDMVLALCAQYGSCFVGSTGVSGGLQAHGSTHMSQYLSDRARSLLLAETESLRIHIVQCHLLSAIYLENNSLTNAAHECIAQALRSASALGLHHEPPATMPEQEKVLRRNIWWSIYIMDVRISLNLAPMSSRIAHKPVHDWIKEVPDLLKTPRTGAGRPFSTARSALDLEDSVPSWLQRQRVMLELSYHSSLMILHRPFIRFPFSSVGRIPISAEHSVWSLKHAIIITQIISQISTESDVLSFVHETTRLLWDATVTLLAFAMAHPFCPHTPSAHAALQTALVTFDVLATKKSDLAHKAARTTHKVLAHMDSIVSGFQTGSQSTPSNTTLRFVNGSDSGEQLQKSVPLPSVAAQHDGDRALTMPPTYTSTMDLKALDLFSGFEVLSDQVVDPTAMSLPPLVDEYITFDGQLLGALE
ncbi:hypothetical protein KCU81_g9786, partial [Aureobasidium melanogenum]